MNRKKILLCIVLLEIISIILKVVFLINNIVWILLDVLILLYIIGALLEFKFMKQRRTNILKDKRNYEKMVICDEMYVKDIDKNNTYMRTNFNRNFYTDFLVLQRYYSFLKEDGQVSFIFDCNNNQYFNKKNIDSIEWPFLHQVTLKENNINLDSLKYKLVRDINAYKIIFYKLGIYRMKNKKDCNIEIIKKKIEQLYDFTKERNLKLNIKIKNIVNLDKLKTEFSEIRFEKI